MVDIDIEPNSECSTEPNRRTPLKWLLSIVIVLVVAAGIAFGTICFSTSSGNSTLNAQSNHAASQLEVSDKEYTPPPAPLYPHGWVIADVSGIPAFSTVEIIAADSFDVVPRSTSGTASFEPSQRSDHGTCRIRYQGIEATVSIADVMLNMPDFFSTMAFDAVYSYSSPSDCAGNEIPGLTGCQVDGYVQGKQYNDYLNKEEFTVPVAYNTAVKLSQVEAALESQGYRLKIWDVYRPYKASTFISSKFKDAYAASPAIREGTGGWALSWYAADGASGHNFGSDIDTTLVDMSGNEISMPSHFDAFDPSAHLVSSPISSSSITERAYKPSVSLNPACLALHRAFANAGFSELASEWWHFGDNETKNEVSSIVGRNGMDFTATIL